MNNQISTANSEASQKEQNQIILYRPNDTISLEVRLEDETIWLTQAQIAELFGTKRPAITKHINNIYSSNELEANSTCSILEHMGNDGNETVWFTQAQIANLFGVGQPAISKHLKNIFTSEELDINSVYSIWNILPNMQILHNTISKFRPTARDINVHFLHVKGVKKR